MKVTLSVIEHTHRDPYNHFTEKKDVRHLDVVDMEAEAKVVAAMLRAAADSIDPKTPNINSGVIHTNPGLYA